MTGLLDLLVPLKRLRVRQQECPWLSNGSLASARHLRDVAHCKALKSGSASDWSSYRKLRNKVNAMLRSAKAEYFQNLSFKSKPGKFWKHFQSLSKRSKPTCGAQISATADAFGKKKFYFVFDNVTYQVIEQQTMMQTLNNDASSRNFWN